MTRYAKRVDIEHGHIRNALRRVTRVLDTSHIGGGFVDLLAEHVLFKTTVFLEVKTIIGKRKPKPKRLTAAQVELRRWLNFTVVTSVEEAMSAVGVSVSS